MLDLGFSMLYRYSRVLFVFFTLLLAFALPSVAVGAMNDYGGGSHTGATNAAKIGDASTGAASGGRIGGVAIVDKERIVSESSVFRGLRAHIVEGRNKIRDEFTKVEKDLKARENALNSQAAILDKKAFEKKKAEFNNKVAESQKLFSSKQAALEKEYLSAVEEIYTGLRNILSEVAMDKGYSLVLLVSKKAEVLYVDGQLDSTDVVLSKLDSRLPDLDYKKLNH